VKASGRSWPGCPKENAELRMRCDVLKRSAAFWVKDAMRRVGCTSAIRACACAETPWGWTGWPPAST
jgi:hypothetical protein